MYIQILINAKLQIGERGQKTTDWEKSFRPAKVRTYWTVALSKKKNS